MSEVYDDFLREFVDHAGSLVLGDPLEPDTDIGPMVSARQRDKVAAQVDAAVAAGAELVTGGGDGGQRTGHFFAPTVVTGAPAQTALLREETFGPVAPIVPVASLDEAIALANSTRFGLGANVYTRDLETVVRCMREIKAGTVWFNDPLTDNDAGPVRRLQAVGAGPRARPGGPRGLPGDQARSHRDQDRGEVLVVSVRGHRVTAPRRNVEIKARDADPAATLERALALGATDEGVLPSATRTSGARAGG